MQFTFQERTCATFPARVEAVRVRELDPVQMETGIWNVKNLLKSQVRRFVRDETGATAIEYGLIAAGISVAIILVVNALGVQLGSTFTNVSTSLANAGQ